jgi:hypothetical protein
MALSTCGGGSEEPAGEMPSPAQLSAKARAGNALFFDMSLSAGLCTLTDGLEPQNPSAYNVPAQCQPGAE